MTSILDTREALCGQVCVHCVSLLWFCIFVMMKNVILLNCSLFVPSVYGLCCYAHILISNK